jgi:hypothetical protein
MATPPQSPLISNAAHIAQLVLAHFLAGGVGYSLRLIQERWRRRRAMRNIESLFGLTDKHVYVVHSAIFDQQRQAFNFPSSDTRASRVVAQLLEKTGRSEFKDFEIVSAEEFERARGSIETGPDVDVIAICGPKRNPIVASVLRKAPPLRYRLQVGEDGRSVLIDQELDTIISGSANVGSDMVLKGPGTDFGIIQAMPNPFNVNRHVTILAGLRGSGTAGVAQILSDASQLAAICKRRKHDIIEGLVKAVWIEKPEQLSSVSLVP